MQGFVPSLLLSLAIGLPAALESCSSNHDGVALGVTARERVALTATASKIVLAEPVREGEPVKKGDILVQLDDRIERADLALASAQLASAQASLAKLRAGARKEELAIAEARVAKARAALQDAQATYERDLTLMQSNARSQAAVDSARARRDAARAELDATEQYLEELRNGARPEEIDMAEAAVASALARVNVARHRLEELTIRASRDGVLYSLPWNLGERVTMGSPVAVLVTGEVPFARVYVPEPARVNVRVGDSLTVHVDGIDSPFEGRVRWISTDPAFSPYYALNQEDRSRLMYLAEIDLPKAAADLAVGIPVQVDMP